MFKAGQRVLFTDKSAHEAGTNCVIIEVDEDDAYNPYFVELTDEDGELVSEWCDADEVEADGEVIE